MWLAYCLQWPNNHIESSREVEDGRHVGQGDACGVGHGVAGDFGGGGLQGPGQVVDFTAIEFVLMRGIEAIAFGEPIFERAGLALIDFAGGGIAADEFGRRRAAMGALAGIVDECAAIVEVHGRVEIGQAKDIARNGDGDGVGCFQAEKVDTGLADRGVGPLWCGRGDIGAHVEFGKGGEPRDIAHPARCDARHAKGHDRNPRQTIIGIDLELRRNVGAHHLDRDGPMGKEEIVPGLAHDPRLGQ